MSWIYWFHEESRNAIKLGHGKKPLRRKRGYTKRYLLTGTKLKGWNYGDDFPDIKWAEEKLHDYLTDRLIGCKRIIGIRSKDNRQAREVFSLENRTFEDISDLLIVACRHIMLAYESNIAKEAIKNRKELPDEQKAKASGRRHYPDEEKVPGQFAFEEEAYRKERELTEIARKQRDAILAKDWEINMRELSKKMEIERLLRRRWFAGRNR